MWVKADICCLKKVRKSPHMRFRDKTAYVWGLGYRWDSSQSVSFCARASLNFGYKIWKNAQNSEKILPKSGKEKLKNLEKYTEKNLEEKNSKKYSGKLGKILPQKPVPGGKITFPKYGCLVCTCIHSTCYKFLGNKKYPLFSTLLKRLFLKSKSVRNSLS